MNSESRWMTYFKGAAFVLPSVSVWAFCTVFLFPKLQEIWDKAGFDDLAMRRILGASNWIVSHGLFIAAVVILLLLGLEWRTRAWSRYRRVSVEVGVLFLNSAVLLLVTTMLTTALMAAPGLRGMK